MHGLRYHFIQVLKSNFHIMHDIRLDGEGITHAFVFQHSRVKAPIVAEIIEEKMMQNIDTCSEYSNGDNNMKSFSFGRSKSYRLGKYTR